MSALTSPRVAGGTEETFLIVKRSFLAARTSATDVFVKALRKIKIEMRVIGSILYKYSTPVIKQQIAKLAL